MPRPPTPPKHRPSDKKPAVFTPTRPPPPPPTIATTRFLEDLNRSGTASNSGIGINTRNVPDTRAKQYHSIVAIAKSEISSKQVNDQVQKTLDKLQKRLAATSQSPKSSPANQKKAAEPRPPLTRRWWCHLSLTGVRILLSWYNVYILHKMAKC